MTGATMVHRTRKIECSGRGACDRRQFSPVRARSAHWRAHVTAPSYSLTPSSIYRTLSERATDALVPRWIFLRALGLIFFSAFYSLARQARGLIGEQGILPVGIYLQQLGEALHGATRYWYAPSLFWI